MSEIPGGLVTALARRILRHLVDALGAPQYMSPEQAAADPPMERRVGLLAVGLLAHEMASCAPGSTRIRWVRLVARIYEVLPLLCPSHGGEMRILSVLTEPLTVQAIPVHLDLPHRPPRTSPARGPPQGDFLLDQTPTFDPAEPEPVPEYEFDPSLPEAWED